VRALKPFVHQPEIVHLHRPEAERQVAAAHATRLRHGRRFRSPSAPASEGAPHGPAFWNVPRA
jgi:hypothetical protein